MHRRQVRASAGKESQPMSFELEQAALQGQQVLLPDLGALSLRGTDAVRFLQGQVSADVQPLSAAHSLLAGYHNAQGRTIAVLRLTQHAPEELLALLPRELAAPVAARLSKFILRSKVSITDVSAAWQVRGLVAPAGLTVPAGLPQDVNAQTALDGGGAIRVAGEPLRWLLFLPAGRPLPAPLAQAREAGRELWRRLDIEAGLPQVVAATSESFVAQMLNLDLLGAVSFEKGCYTGQEVIARAHWRGRVKRRLQRFITRAPAQLAPGDTRTLADGRTVTVVEAVQTGEGRCEFLAVAPLSAEREEAASGTPEADVLDTQALALPYALPAP
jgi:tRNA-modifying protein YgfZ